MEKLKIEKGIKLVPINTGILPAEHPFPFKSMEVGDSFLFKGPTKRNWAGYNETYSYLYNHMYKYRKNISYSIRPQFVIRKVDGGFRCWRTK